MKRVMLTLAAVVCCLGTIVANPVSPDAARRAAQRFVQAKGGTLKSEAMRAPRHVMAGSEITELPEVVDAPAYYVFNADAGFVVVSGDDCVGQNLILGYTTQGSFDANSVPENLQWWLDTMQKQISTLGRLGARAKAVALHADIDALVTARWNQGVNYYNPKNPYNRFCPDTFGQLCVTGCMATALAQVLYTHRCPQGPLAAPLPAYQMKDGRTMDELPAVTFDWDNMVDDYLLPTTDEQQTAVATLMRYCGQLLQMDYTPTVSNAFLYDVHQLVTVFGIDPNVSLAYADGYSVSGWDELLYQELSEGRPLVYGGCSTGGGHAFIIDGYQVDDGSGYYHVNWGWGGEADGYYNISLLAPKYSGTGASTTSDGYNSNQEAIIHLQPAATTAAPAARYLVGYAWDENVNGTPHIFMLYNTSYAPGTFTIGLAEKADDGTIDYSRIYKEEDVDLGGYRFATNMGGTYYMIDNVPGSGLTPGRHQLVLVNREKLSGAGNGDTAEASNGQVPWKPLFGPNNSIEVVVDDDGLFTEMIYHPNPQLDVQAGQLTIDGLKQWGLPQQVTATIVNSSNDDYIGTVECDVYVLQGDGMIADLVHYSSTGIFMEAGSTADLQYKVAMPRAGSYVLLLAKKNQATNLKGTKFADIASAPGYIAHQVITIDELQFRCNYLQYTTFQYPEGPTYYYLDCGIVNDTPTDYLAALVAKLYYKDNLGNWQPLTFPNVSEIYGLVNIPASVSGRYPIYLPQSLTPGEYAVELQMANDFVSLTPADYFTFFYSQFVVDDTPTAIDDLQIADGDSKNGNNRQWFDLLGRSRIDHRKAANPQWNGIYVKDGRKVVVTSTER